MSSVVLGFVGCGFMAQVAHIANYATLPGVRLKGLFDLKQQQARLVAARYGVERVYASLDALLADPEIDAVVCTLFWDQNARVAQAALAAGKHVVTEKPLAGFRGDAQAIVRAAERYDRHACIGYMKCYDAGVEKARHIVANWGRAPDFVQLHFGGGDWVRNIAPAIITDEKPADGSPGHWAPPHFDEAQRDLFHFFINEHVHHLSMLRFLLGQELKLQKVIRHGAAHIVVFTAGSTLVSLQHTPLENETWDESTRLHWRDGYVHIKTPSPLLQNIPAKVEVYRHAEDGMGGERISFSLPASWSFQRAAAHFVRVVRGEEPPRTPASHGLLDVIHCEDIVSRAFASS